MTMWYTVITRRNSQGSALLLALFTLVVMSLLGISLMRLLHSQSQATGFEVYGTRALMVAESALELQLTELFPLVGAANCVASTDYDLSSIEGLHGCRAQVTCQPLAVNELNSTLYQLVAIGRCQAGDFRTERVVEAQARELSR